MWTKITKNKKSLPPLWKDIFVTVDWQLYDGRQWREVMLATYRDDGKEYYYGANDRCTYWFECVDKIGCEYHIARAGEHEKRGNIITIVAWDEFPDPYEGGK